MICKVIAGKSLVKWMQCLGKTAAGSLIEIHYGKSPVAGAQIYTHTHTHTHTSVIAIAQNCPADKPLFRDTQETEESLASMCLATEGQPSSVGRDG